MRMLRGGAGLLVVALILTACGSVTPTASTATATATAAASQAGALPTPTVPAPAPSSPTASPTTAPTPTAVPFATVDDLLARPLPSVSAASVLALVPPTPTTVTFQALIGQTLKDIPSKDLTNLGIVVRLCVGASPLETAAEQAVERQMDCLLAVGGAWDAYATQAAPSAELLARARAMYAYSVGRLGTAGAAWLDRVLRDQLPRIAAGPGSTAPSPSAPSGLVSAKQLLASKGAPVSALAFLAALRDWRASHLAQLVTAPMVNGGSWDAGASSQSDQLAGGQFGTNAYLTAKKRFVVVSNSGMSVHDMTGPSGTYYQGGSVTATSWALSDFLVAAWGAYRRSGDKADYAFAVTALRFMRSPGPLSGLPSETVDQLTAMP